MTNLNRPRLSLPQGAPRPKPKHNPPRPRPATYEQSLIGKLVRIQTKSPSIFTGTLATTGGAFIVLHDAMERRWANDSVTLHDIGISPVVVIDRSTIATIYHDKPAEPAVDGGGA